MGIFLVGFVVLVLLALITLAVIQHKTISALSEQNLAVHTEKEQPNQMHTENLAAPPHDQEVEIRQLRENNQDLMRLRNEVRTLREQNRELEALRAANVKLLAAIQDATRSNAAALTASALRQGGRLGIVIGQAAISPEGAATSPGPAGVIVKEIVEDTAAADSELRPMDVIVAVDGRRITTGPELQIEMLTKQPGQPVALDVVRTGAVLRVEIKTRAWVDDK
jgi:C-terminal processing protease CtpA/Prc